MQPLTIKSALHFSPLLPNLDREVLLSFVLQKDRTFLLAHDDVRLTASELKRYQTFLRRREQDEPIAYIIGEKEFYGRTFCVGPGVLIPRPETEILVEHVVKQITTTLPSQKKIAVIDVGTGTSAIITSVYLSLKEAHRKKIDWYALEKESAALRFARKNAKAHGVTDAIHFKKSDLLSAIEKKLLAYDELFVIANLPYLSKVLYRSTEPNVKNFEPKSALVSGSDGLVHYCRLMKELLRIRKHGENIHFSFEISPEQAIPCSKWISTIVAKESLRVIPDLAGKNRIVSGTLI